MTVLLRNRKRSPICSHSDSRDTVPHAQLESNHKVLRFTPTRPIHSGQIIATTEQRDVLETDLLQVYRLSLENISTVVELAIILTIAPETDIFVYDIPTRWLNLGELRLTQVSL